MPIPAGSGSGSGSGPAPDGLSYDPVLSRVRLSKRVPPSTLGVVVDRSTDGVRWATVRGAAELATPGGGLVSVSDYEFTADVVNQYRLRAYASGGVELGPALNSNPFFEDDNPILNANPFFETSASSWSAVGGTAARSTAQSHEGVASLLLTPNGVAATVEAQAEVVTVTAGADYRASAWARCAVARNVSVNINWHTAAGVYISTSTATVAVAATTWTYLDLSATAPPTAGLARILATMGGTPPASHTLHIDEATLRVATPAGWTAAGGAVARSTAQAHEGAASMLLTPDGVSASAEARADYVPAVAGQSYRAMAWVRCSVSRSVGVGVNWYQAGGAFISQSTVSVPVTANTWTLLEMSATAPALTGQARLLSGLSGTPPVSNTMHVDEAFLIQVGGRIFAGSIVPDLDRVWLKNVARPFLNRPVTVVDYSDVERPSRAGVFDVVGRSFPVSVNDVRGSRRWTMEVLTQTLGEADELDLVLASGDPMFIHVPADVDVPGGHVVIGDTSRRRTSRLGPRRVFELPCTEIAAPGPDVVGATVTCQTVLAMYPTCTAVLDAHATCLSLMELIGDPTDVIVP